MMQEDQPSEVVFMGRLIGTATGEDEADEVSFILYGFTTIEGVDIGIETHNETVTLNSRDGCLQMHDDAGEVSCCIDLVVPLANYPRHASCTPVLPLTPIEDSPEDDDEDDDEEEEELS